MKNQLTRLIQKGRTFKFDDNCNFRGDDSYTKASRDLLKWISKVEVFITAYYGKENLPFRHFQRFEIKYLNGYPEWYFNQQLAILNQALMSCQVTTLKTAPKNFHMDASLVSIVRKFWAA